MDAKIVGEGEVRKKKYVPTKNDYKLTSVRIEDAENGVVVECSYSLKKEVSDKMKKDGYYDTWEPPRRHVFENKEDAKTFILGELNELWAD